MKNVDLTINLTPEMEKRLRRLLETGLYGNSLQATTERVLCWALLANPDAVPPAPMGK